MPSHLIQVRLECAESMCVSVNLMLNSTSTQRQSQLLPKTRERDTEDVLRKTGSRDYSADLAPVSAGGIGRTSSAGY